MHFTVVGVLVAQVVLHVLGQQVAAVAGGVDQHVVAGRGDAAVKDAFQRLVAGLAFVEAQVVAKHDEAFGALGHQVHQIRQVDQVGLVHLDQAQALGRKLIQAGLDQAAFAAAAGANEKTGFALQQLLNHGDVAAALHAGVQQGVAPSASEVACVV